MKYKLIFVGVLSIAAILSTVYFFTNRNNDKLSITESRSNKISSIEKNKNLVHTSMMAIDLLIEKKETIIVYYDRSDCSDCDLFNPLFSEYLNSKNINEIYRVDLEKTRADSTDEEWDTFKKRIGIDQTPALVSYLEGDLDSIIQQEDNIPLTVNAVDKWMNKIM